MTARPLFDGCAEPDSSTSKYCFGIGEVCVCGNNGVHPLSADAEHLRDLGDANEIAHRRTVERGRVITADLRCGLRRGGRGRGAGGGRGRREARGGRREEGAGRGWGEGAGVGRRRGPPGSHNMQAVRMTGFMTYGYCMSTADAPEPPRGPGRPRKWANEAERVRAYRQRKAEEHVSVDELRLERRVLKRQLSDALRGRARAESALARATARIESLESALERTEARLRSTETDLACAQSHFRELLEQRGPAAQASSPEHALSRQQRRARERNERKRKP